MAAAKIAFVHGWRIRAPESVRRQADKIREYFRPVAGLEDASRQGVEVIVVVHLRSGDDRVERDRFTVSNLEEIP
jgi:hypothetical protein